MNKYAVRLWSKVREADVWIEFLVNTPMNKNQLKVYYEYQSLSITNVEVFDL